MTYRKMHRSAAPLHRVLLAPALAFLLAPTGYASEPTAQPGSAAATESAAAPKAAKQTLSRKAADATRASATKKAIRVLEQRVSQDPENFAVQNMLAGYYLKQVKETGDHAYLARAATAAEASLAAVPAERNHGGMAALAQVEAASHNFAAARDHAQKLGELAPNKRYPYEILGDALLELGDYEGAASAYERVRQFGASTSITTRLGRLALLNGKTENAKSYFAQSLALALDDAPPAPEVIAWCYWQLGDTAFSIGDYANAERHYHEALAAVADYLPALAALGRVRAARGDLVAAIAAYERATEIDPMPVFVAALGDLYELAGRQQEAALQYAKILEGERSALDTRLDNRQLVMFYADHDLKREEAYRLAADEYRSRRDIYGADAFAWAALKAGKLAEAQAAAADALRLGTQDAKLFYHAGMIAGAAGDKSRARAYLKRALALNPQFDPLQAKIAQQALID